MREVAHGHEHEIGNYKYFSYLKVRRDTGNRVRQQIRKHLKLRDSSAAGA